MNRQRYVIATYNARYARTATNQEEIRRSFELTGPTRGTTTLVHRSCTWSASRPDNGGVRLSLFIAVRYYCALTKFAETASVWYDTDVQLASRWRLMLDIASSIPLPRGAVRGKPARRDDYRGLSILVCVLFICELRGFCITSHQRPSMHTIVPFFLLRPDKRFGKRTVGHACMNAFFYGN